MSSSALKQFFLGFTAPVYSARFLFQKKSLFIIGVAPHLLNLILYFWLVNKFIIGKWLSSFLISLQMKTHNEFILYIIKVDLIEIIIWVCAFLLYGVLGTSFVNAVASPIYDYIAMKSYEFNSNNKLPVQTFADFIDSVISEITKWIFIVCVFIISLFIPMSAPILFLGSIWYLGWVSIDRTLLLLNLPLAERIKFGIENMGLCVGLGLWCYIPFLSPLFAFTIASAGAALVAKTDIPYFSDNSPGADF